MRYTSAVVLSTLAVGQAAAATVNHRHASFHARREASKRSPNAPEVDWSKVAIDLKDVDWNAVNWSSVFASPAAKAEPTAVQQYDPAPVVATPTPEPEKETPAPAPAPSSSKPVESSKPEAPEDHSDPIGDAVDDLMEGVASISSAISAKIGVNADSPNGGIWTGNSGEFGMDITNTGSGNAVWYCWVKGSGFEDMVVRNKAPAISIGIPAGATRSVSIAAKVSGGCAPADENTSTGTFGGLDQTWAEFTSGNDEGKFATFNVSKNPNMFGASISMVGSQCTANMTHCVFQCKDTSAKSCTYGYDLLGCDASNGGGGGYDTVMAGVGGGCTWNDAGERLAVSFSL